MSVGHWTDCKIERMRELHAKGISAAKIARALGPPFTRNSVLGKLFRLGLSVKGGKPSLPAYQPTRLMGVLDPDWEG